MNERRTVNPWYYIAAGCAIGIPLGLMLAPFAGFERSTSLGEDEEPSLASKVAAKIPTKVKVAGVVGGVKGAGGEAYQEIKQKVSGDPA